MIIGSPAWSMPACAGYVAEPELLQKVHGTPVRSPCAMRIAHSAYLGASPGKGKRRRRWRRIAGLEER